MVENRRRVDPAEYNGRASFRREGYLFAIRSLSNHSDALCVQRYRLGGGPAIVFIFERSGEEH